MGRWPVGDRLGTSDVVPVVDEQMRYLWWKSGDKRESRRRGVVAGAMQRRCNASYDMVAGWIRVRWYRGVDALTWNWQQPAGTDLCRASAIAVLLLPAAKRP